MKNYKNIFILFLMIILISTSIGTSFATDNLKSKTEEKDPRIQSEINELEKEINEMRELLSQELQQSINQVETMSESKLKLSTDFTSIDNYTDYLIEEYDENANNKEREILLKHGFVPLQINKDSKNLVEPLSLDTSMSFSEENIYYNPTTKLYRYVSEWTWKTGSWDEFADITDVVGVGITKPSDFLIYSTTLSTFDNKGTQTGFVNNNGNHSPSNSFATKRFEDNNGVCFNVNDTPSVNGQVGVIKYHTHKGRIVLFLKALRKSDTKIITTYNHNYKTGSLQGSAKFSLVKFKSGSGALEVTYSKVNKSWIRSSGGKIVNAK